MQFKFIIAFASIMLLCSCSPSSNSSPGKTIEIEADKPIQYDDIDRPLFSMKVPSTWQKDETGRDNTLIIVYAPVDNSRDRYRENVNIISSMLDGQSTDLGFWGEKNKGSIKHNMPNAKLLYSRLEEEKGYFEMSFKDVQQHRQLKWLQRFYVHNNRGYILTFSCEEDKYDQYYPEVLKLLNSFTPLQGA